MDKNRNPWPGASALVAACTVLALVSTMVFAQFDAGRLERVQGLNSPRLDGVIPTYYTPGFEQRAREVQRFVTAEVGFAQRQLGVKLFLSVAVLDKVQ